MTANPYQDIAKEMMDLWQKQMSSMMGDKKFIEAMLGLFQNMQPNAHAKSSPSSNPANTSDAERNELSQLAFRLAMCEKRIAALEAGGGKKTTAKKSGKALEQEAKSRTSQMLSGILRYYETPYERSVSEKPVIWQKGAARLLDYGQGIENFSNIVLFIPSLINRYYILDLEEERSFLRFLAMQGIYPLVLDWGMPSEFEQDFVVEDYITQILAPAIDYVAKNSGGQIALAGYCMGGVLALAASKLKRRKISSLTLLATPWDFHCPEFTPFVLAKKWQAEIAKTISVEEMLSAEFIQSLFYLTDPFLFEHKFRRYFEMAENSREAKDFVALEHWVNDGVPMTSGVARDCLIGWAQENNLAQGRFTVSGKKITPPPKNLPTFIAIPRNDHVVPFDCAMPLAIATLHAEIIHPGAGHVGMIVGRNAKRELWQPYANWLNEVGH